MSDSPRSNRPIHEPRQNAKKSKKGTAKKAKLPLLFIDTNILLDFYRSRNDAGISLLSKIDSLHGQTITTCQVEMEFKKNRQKVMSESVSLLKAPDFNLSTPAFLSDAATVKVIKNRIQDVKKRVEKLKQRVLSTLENPKTHDRIYQTIQRLFNNPSPLNLRYNTPEYKAVWRRATRRFFEGRPPRKKEDTSAGDAVNWEWIVQCVEDTNRDVIIVSRDADYGLALEGKSYANNWLTDEIKERVNQKRKLVLVDRLSSALKLLDVEVTAAEVSSEASIIKTPSVTPKDEVEAIVENSLHDILNGEEIASLIAKTNTCGWSCDIFELNDAQHKNGIWTVEVSFVFVGDQEDDKPWCGDTIVGSCILTIDAEKKVAITNIEAELESDKNWDDNQWYGNDGPDDEPEPDDEREPIKR